MTTKTSPIPMTSRSAPERGATLHLGVAGALLCSACTPSDQSKEVNIADAAQTARETNRNYQRAPSNRPARDNDVAPRPAPSFTQAPSAGAGAGADASADAAEEARDGPGAQAAAQVLRDYHGLIAERRYDEAWRLWDRDGKASGMSRKAFADSFAKYRNYHARIGPPGRIEAGAGQRYVTIPVTVTGTLRDGRAVVLAGPMVLHRAGPIDGATARQRRWRLHDSGLKPRPAETTAADQITAHYACDDGTNFEVQFDNRANTALLALPSGKARLTAQPVASGIRYAGDGYALRGKGAEAILSRPGQSPVTCRSTG